jgi:hypothetical protein
MIARRQKIRASRRWGIFCSWILHNSIDDDDDDDDGSSASSSLGFFSLLSLSLCDDEFFPKKVRTSILHLAISCAKNNPLLHSTKASLLLRQLLCKRIFIRHSSSGDSSAKDLHKHSSSAALLENIIFTDTLLQELQFSNRNLHSSTFFFTNSYTMKNLKPFMVILGVQPELLPQAHEATMPSSMFSRLPTPTSEPRTQRKTLRIGKA